MESDREFPVLRVDAAGEHLVIPMSAVQALIEAGKANQLLEVPKLTDLSLSFLVRYYRFLRDWSRADLAGKSEVHERTIQNIESTPGFMPGQTVLKKLGKAFGENFSLALTEIEKVKQERAA